MDGDFHARCGDIDIPWASEESERKFDGNLVTKARWMWRKVKKLVKNLQALAN
jgi:hypothetical protein